MKESAEQLSSAFSPDAILELARCDGRFWQAYRLPCMRIPLVHSSRYVSHCENLIRHIIRVRLGPLQCMRHLGFVLTLYVIQAD